MREGAMLDIWASKRLTAMEEVCLDGTAVLALSFEDGW
jgi:hypothetical protein